MDRYIYNRVVQWNRARYSRTYNAALYKAMLSEEFFEEYKKAVGLVDKLDGLSDIFFISVGALWKLDANPYNYLSERRPTALIYPLETDKPDPENVEEMQRVIYQIFEIPPFRHIEDHYITKRYISYLLELTLREFHFIGCVQTEAALAINIICDSNDTKLSPLLNNFDKGVLKGTEFIPPTKRLGLLARSIQNG